VDQYEVVEKIKTVFETTLIEQKVKLSEIKTSNFEWLLIFQMANNLYFQIQIDWRESFLTLQLGRNLNTEVGQIVDPLCLNEGAKFVQDVAKNLNINYLPLNKKLNNLFGKPNKFEDMAAELANFLKKIISKIVIQT
jgi:hypothetical protein